MAYAAYWAAGLTVCFTRHGPTLPGVRGWRRGQALNPRSCHAKFCGVFTVCQRGGTLLVINTGTTIITFLMVFLIQNTQNRDTEAIQLKLDELIRATQGAHNALLDLEELEEESLDAFKRRYQTLAAGARASLSAGEQDTGTPEP